MVGPELCCNIPQVVVGRADAHCAVLMDGPCARRPRVSGPRALDACVVGPGAAGPGGVRPSRVVVRKSSQNS